MFTDVENMDIIQQVVLLLLVGMLIALTVNSIRIDKRDNK